MKMYFLCEEHQPAWWICNAVLENGFYFGQHVCSSPGFAPGDLYFGRPERIAALEEMFGKRWQPAETETVIIRDKSDIPAAWTAGDKDELAKWSERYNEIRNRQKAPGTNPNQP